MKDAIYYTHLLNVIGFDFNDQNLNLLSNILQKVR